MSVQDKTDFTQGSIIRKMLPFMGPILGALILQAAYGAVDLLVVGRFGSTAGLSAVSTGSQVLNLVTFVITALAMGVTVLIARYIGEKNTDQIGELLGGATTIFAILAVVLAVPMYANAAGIVPIIEVFVAKGIPLGTAIAFMMGVVGLSLPEATLLKKVMTWRLIGVFFGTITLFIVLLGYLFNFIL